LYNFLLLLAQLLGFPLYLLQLLHLLFHKLFYIAFEFLQTLGVSIECLFQLIFDYLLLEDPLDILFEADGEQLVTMMMGNLALVILAVGAEECMLAAVGIETH
jgi:hypothetical protein